MGSLVKKNFIALFSVLSLLVFLSCNNNIPVTDIFGVTAPVAVKSIVFAPALPANPLPLSIGGTYQLHAKVQPENATNKKLTYISDNETVASVDAEGLITAKAAGSAKITVKALMLFQQTLR